MTYSNPRRKLTSKATITSKNKFLSVIKQARVRQVEGSRSQYAEYEVLCQMRSVGLGIEKEKICKWSVWRRYSEIKKLFYKMKNTLGKILPMIMFMVIVFICTHGICSTIT